MGAALRFFLTGEEEGGEGDEGDSESSDESGAESRALRDIVLSRQTVKSGRKRERKVARARAVLKVGGGGRRLAQILLTLASSDLGLGWYKSGIDLATKVYIPVHSSIFLYILPPEAAQEAQGSP